MGKLKERYLHFTYKGIIGIILIFSIIASILFIERTGIQFNYVKAGISFMPEDKIVTKAEAAESLVKDTLYLYDSTQPDSIYAKEQFDVIFDDIKAGHDDVDLATETMPDYTRYKKIVIAMPDISPIGKNIIPVCDWVHKGGNLMFACVIYKNAYTSIIADKLGIVDSSYNNYELKSFYVEPDFMIGGGRSFVIDEPFDSSWEVKLDKQRVRVHVYSDDARLPVIWESDYGEGTFIVNNLGMYGKAYRGFNAACYSLMGAVSAYPVINGSTFYLDDFPSQIPQGENEYIKKDYGTSIRDFYVNIWWPDMMNFADKYGLKYTGLAIKSYNDDVDGTIIDDADKGTFLNFGNMLLRMGGEIGYHGYNHQPLCFDNCDYKGLYDYKTWESRNAMKAGFDDLVDFCDELFPDINMQIYVPPSNILSDEGKEFLLSEYPHIRTVSGIYFEDDDLDFSGTQEYEVYPNGVVDQPRIVSGCHLNPFMEIAVISELNFHFINNHFTHPDDALDPDRGATLGWERLTSDFDSYLNWIYSSAPTLRNLTGTEMSAAVQRYMALSPKIKTDEHKMKITLDNFYDEAYMMMRFNKKAPGKVTGGELEHLTGDLYLLKAKKANVTIELK